MANLTKILNGSIRILQLSPITVDNLPDHRPPAGKAWLILGGKIYHVTGTDTKIDIDFDPTAQGGQVLNTLQLIPSAIATMTRPLFQQVPEANGFCAQYTPIIVTGDRMYLYTAGDAASHIELEVLEFDYI